MRDDDKVRSPMTPEEIVAAKNMTRQQKIDRLREMSYDAREMDVANEEGMGGGLGSRPPASSRLDRILDALRSLGAEDQHSGTKH